MDEDTIPTFEYIKKLNDYNLAYVHLSEPLQISEIPYARQLNISVLYIMEH
jgi:N-ethylmaleimide reductase